MEQGSPGNLQAERIRVVEVDRPNRQRRRRKGKSDPQDAITAARAALSGDAAGEAKTRDGNVESMRVLRVARASARKGRTQALNQMRGLISTAPEPIRAELRGLNVFRLLERASTYRPGSKRDIVSLTKFSLGRARLSALLIRSSAGLWRKDKADELLAMADETLALWSGGGIDVTELAHDIASEVRVLRRLDDEIAAADKRITVLYDEADPKGIVASAPGIGPVLSAAILGNAGDFNRFANLAGVRSFTGFVRKIDQSGLVAGRKGITKAGDAGLRRALYMAADHARHIDPTLAQRYHRLVMVEGKNHNSALCSVSAVLITRIATC